MLIVRKSINLAFLCNSVPSIDNVAAKFGGLESNNYTSFASKKR